MLEIRSTGGVPVLRGGAGAALIGVTRGRHGIRDSALHTFGELSSLIEVPAGGSSAPYAPESHAEGLRYFSMDGRGVREFVGARLAQLVKKFLHECDVLPQRIAHFVPHQANGVMLDEVFGQLNLPRAVVHKTLTYYGNTGAASIPLTLDAAARTGALNAGDLVLLAAFGGGMSVGLTLVEW